VSKAWEQDRRRHEPVETDFEMPSADDARSSRTARHVGRIAQRLRTTRSAIGAAASARMTSAVHVVRTGAWMLGTEVGTDAIPDYRLTHLVVGELRRLQCEGRDDQDEPSQQSGTDPDRTHVDFQPSYMQATLADRATVAKRKLPSHMGDRATQFHRQHASPDCSPRARPAWLSDPLVCPASNRSWHRLPGDGPQTVRSGGEGTPMLGLRRPPWKVYRFCGRASLGRATPLRRSSCAPGMCGVLGKGLSVPSHSVCSQT
jgi:hypothetical protein